MKEELQRIDESVGRWCRRTASVEIVGPFELFVEPAPFAPKFARPVGGRRIERADLDALVHRQEQLGLPLELEAVRECHEGVLGALVTNGWQVVQAPLMIHRTGGSSVSATAAGGAVLRVVEWDDADLARVDAIGHVAFSAPGMAVGQAGVAETRAAASTHDPASNRVRLRRGDMVMVVATEEGEPVAYGSLLLDTGAPMAEVVAVGTVPSHRRRGLGGAVTSELVALARRRGVETIWLSAADSAVASMYGRLGFETVGNYLMASFAA